MDILKLHAGAQPWSNLLMAMEGCLRVSVCAPACFTPWLSQQVLPLHHVSRLDLRAKAGRPVSGLTAAE